MNCALFKLHLLIFVVVDSRKHITRFVEEVIKRISICQRRWNTHWKTFRTKTR